MSDRSFEFISNDPVGYERLFGRGSCHLSVPFIEFAGVMAHEKVLDVGCGTGNLTISLAAAKAFATGIDLSWSYLHHARQRISDASVKFTLGDAMKLPYQDDSFDRTLSMLALDLFLDPVLCLSEMRRVTRPGGIVAALVIDFRCGWTPFSMLWDTAAVLDSRAKVIRDWSMSKPMSWPGGLTALFHDAGIEEMVESRINSFFEYSSFEDYWSGFLGGQGKIGSYVLSLSDVDRAELKRHVRAAYLCGMTDGPRAFSTGFWAVRGAVQSTIR